MMLKKQPHREIAYTIVSSNMRLKDLSICKEDSHMLIEKMLCSIANQSMIRGPRFRFWNHLALFIMQALYCLEERRLTGQRLRRLDIEDDGWSCDKGSLSECC